MPTGPSHTVILPVQTALWASLYFPRQTPFTKRTLTLDCRAFLSDAGTTLASADVQVDPSITLVSSDFDNASVTCTLTGGTAGTAPPVTGSGLALGGAAYAWAGVASQTGHSDSSARLAAFGTTSTADYNSPCGIFAFLAGAATLAGFQGGELSGGAIGIQPFQAASVFDGATHTMTLDGTADAALAASAIAPSFVTLVVGAGNNGVPGGNCWDGAQAEHIVTSGALSPADQAAIRASQQAYYGTP